jgi:hypothetical protein
VYNTGATDTEGIGVRDRMGGFYDRLMCERDRELLRYRQLHPVLRQPHGCMPLVAVIDSSSTYDCGDGNLAITYDNLAAGTYYIPVYSDLLAAWGLITIEISCDGLRRRSCERRLRERHPGGPQRGIHDQLHRR